jgi:hypothetical protein
MPSKNPKPRLAVSLTPATFAIFKRFGELNDRPMASCVSELLEASAPEFANLCTLLAQARTLENQSQAQQAEFLKNITSAATAAEAGQSSLALLVHEVTQSASSEHVRSSAAGAGTAAKT